VAVINFNCPHCRQNMDAASDLIGLNLPCPTCDKPLRVPVVSDPPPKPINFDCPYCSQNIDAPFEMTGLEIPCPTCKGQMQIPGKRPGGRPGIEPPMPAVAPQEAARAPAPALMATPGSGSQKGSTIRIEMPEALLPAEIKRQVIIKRNTSSPKRRVTFSPTKPSARASAAPPARKTPSSRRPAKNPGGLIGWLLRIFGD
jgi:Zn finger protein HypA/HybF involved in hydrogenase expression